MDPYVYPGTSVLRNLRDIRAPERLARFEADATSGRISELEEKPVTGTFDSRHFQTIHHYIFQDVYPWAGEFRTVNISRPGGMFAFQEFIVPSINKAFGELGKERYLSGADLKRFSNRAAYYMGEINAIHPFREGNGRTQREFIRQLAQRNGYALNWSRVSQEQVYEASKSSFQRGDNSGLEMAIRAVSIANTTTPEKRTQARRVSVAMRNANGRKITSGAIFAASSWAVTVRASWRVFSALTETRRRLIMSTTTERNQPHDHEKSAPPCLVVLQECIEPVGLTITDAAALGVTRNTLSELVNGKRGIFAEMAVRLSKVFGGTEQGWLAQQAQYDLAQVRGPTC